MMLVWPQAVVMLRKLAVLVVGSTVTDAYLQVFYGILVQ